MELIMSEVISPLLYILMRNDLASLNTEKAMAQASHASNSFVHLMNTTNPDFKPFKEWTMQTEQGFGTVLVLAVNEHEMRKSVYMAEKSFLFAGIVHDPTYPLIDGETVHYIPLDTCAWIF